MQNVSEQIHRASLEILKDPGVCLHDSIVIEVLKKRGVQVEGQRVRLTEEQVMECLATAPSTFTLMGRNARRTISIGNNSRCIAPAYGAPEIVTADHQRRRACFNDYIRIAKLVQATSLSLTEDHVLLLSFDCQTKKRELESQGSLRLHGH